MIVNTYSHATGPIHVIKPDEFGGEKDSSVPVVLAYNGFHYESMEPYSINDVELTKNLVKSYCNTTYAYDNLDIDYLIGSSAELKPYQNPWPYKPANAPTRVRTLSKETIRRPTETSEDKLSKTKIKNIQENQQMAATERQKNGKNVRKKI